MAATCALRIDALYVIDFPMTATAAAQAFAEIHSRAEELRTCDRADPRTVRFFEGNLEGLRRAVSALQSHLSPDDASELMETWRDYTNIPETEFKQPDILQDPDRRECYVEDILQHYLDELVRIASAVK
jgi:hypothetical protein